MFCLVVSIELLLGAAPPLRQTPNLSHTLKIAHLSARSSFPVVLGTESAMQLALGSNAPVRRRRISCAFGQSS